MLLSRIKFIACSVLLVRNFEACFAEYGLVINVVSGKRKAEQVKRPFPFGAFDDLTT